MDLIWPPLIPKTNNPPTLMFAQQIANHLNVKKPTHNYA
jgi:hypothetical protein